MYVFRPCVLHPNGEDLTCNLSHKCLCKLLVEKSLCLKDESVLMFHHQEPLKSVTVKSIRHPVCCFIIVCNWLLMRFFFLCTLPHSRDYQRCFENSISMSYLIFIAFISDTQRLCSACSMGKRFVLSLLFPIHNLKH